jgi:hypothetical protein
MIAREEKLMGLEPLNRTEGMSIMMMKGRNVRVKSKSGFHP